MGQYLTGEEQKKIPSDSAYMLGFEKEQFSDLERTTGKIIVSSLHPVDTSCSLTHLHLYCNILSPQIVDNVLAPLLQIIST